jgi:hypothetical protein
MPNWPTPTSLAIELESYANSFPEDGRYGQWIHSVFPLLWDAARMLDEHQKMLDSNGDKVLMTRYKKALERIGTWGIPTVPDTEVAWEAAFKAITEYARQEIWGEDYANP